MNPGRLRHTVTLRRNTESRDTDGDVIRTPADLADRQAEIRPLRGRELMEARQVHAEVTHAIEIRYYPGLTAKDHITWNSRTFEIIEVRNLHERNHQMSLLCKETT
jgi:SPP1 family predicted phage head-tail adaptor